MADTMILHNPRCSKSRAAVAFLAEAGVEADVREYLKQPLSQDELRILGKKLGRPPAEWIRWNQAEAKEAGIARDDPPMQLYRAMAEHPILMERPIVIRGAKAVVGRPDPGDVLAAFLR